MVETHFSSDGYYPCVTSQTYEASQAIYTTYVIAWSIRKGFSSVDL